jgi:hypothetical protein
VPQARDFFEGKTIMGKTMKTKSNRFALNSLAFQYGIHVMPAQPQARAKHLFQYKHCA